MKKYSLLASTLIAATAFAVPAFANTVTWTGESNTEGDDDETIYKWSDGGNWDSAGDVWVSLDSATFTEAATNKTVTVDGAISITNLEVTGGDYIFKYVDGASISMDGATGSFSVDSGGSLTITGGKTTTSGTRAFIDGKLTLAGGTNYFEHTNMLEIATSADISATLEITDGTNEFGNTYLGYNGTGTMTISGGKNTFVAQFWIGYNESSSGILEITGGTVQGENTTLWIGYNGTGTFKISGGSTEYDWTTIHVGFNGVGTLEITGGTKADFYHTNIYIGDSTGESKIAISGGENNLFETAIIYVGYGNGAFTEDSEATSGASGTFTISGGTNTFNSGCKIYVGSEDGQSGTFTISGGETTMRGSTTVYNNGTLTISGGETTVNLEKQIGTSTTGTVKISDNAKIVLSGALLESIEELIGTSGSVVVIEASSITINGTLLSNQNSNDALAAIIGSSISAEGYDLTWHYSDGVLSVVSVTEAAAPEPSMFGMLLGLGALGLVATRRRRRKA